MNDLQSAAATALKTTALGAELSPEDKSNPWAVFDNYIDRVVVQCVNSVTPKWQSRLAGYDVYIWDQCFANGAEPAHRLSGGDERLDER